MKLNTGPDLGVLRFEMGPADNSGGSEPCRRAALARPRVREKGWSVIISGGLRR